MLKTTCATIALCALSVTLADPALAAGCANPAEAAALKTAVMQQELMVAALQCHESGAYNRFVIAYRPELQDSDAALKAFFVRRGGEHGEAGYDTFKTKTANLSALEQARDTRAFIYLKLGDFSKAISEYGLALQTDPNHARALYGRGLAKAKSGDKTGGDADMANAVRPKTWS